MNGHQEIGNGQLTYINIFYNSYPVKILFIQVFCGSIKG